MKAFFIKFAKSRGLDPLVPETWYAISRKEVKDEKVFAFIVAFSTSFCSTKFLIGRGYGVGALLWRVSNHSNTNISGYWPRYDTIRSSTNSWYVTNNKHK